MPIIHHAKKVGFLRRLLRLVRNIDVASEYRGLDLCCLEDPLDGFYLVKDGNAWWRKLDFESRQQHYARGLGFIRCHSFEMLALPPSEGNDYYSPEPHGWQYDSNCCLGIPIPVMFSC